MHSAKPLTLPLEIPLSKGKLVLLALGAAAFVVAGWLLYDHAPQIRGYHPLFIRGAGIASMVFFGVCGIFAARKLLDTTPGLVVDSLGLVDNSSGVAAGRIAWSDITGFTVKEIHKQRFLTILVKDSRKYVDSARGFKRLLAATNARYFGSPIQISANTLRIGFDDLMRIITEARARYTGRERPAQELA